MTPEQQIKEIILMLSPEDPNTTDAVFLVKQYMDKQRALQSASAKQIALIEAEKEKLAKDKHDLMNEKLASEAQLKKEKEELAKQLELPLVERQRGKTF